MAETLGYHVVLTAYGLWLPGDGRGSWSAAWDEHIGFVRPHQLNPGDPVRHRMARESMSQPAVRFTPAMQQTIVRSLQHCNAESDWQLAALTVESTHLHLLMTYTGRPIEATVKWIKQRCTKAVHQHTGHVGKVWCEGSWRVYVRNARQWNATLQYIQRHNTRHGQPANPYDFVTPITM